MLAVAALLFSGCGASKPTASTNEEPLPPEPTLTPTERLVGVGANLIVTDGCTACHLEAKSRQLGPSFDRFAGRRVTLADGRRVLVDPQFISAALRHPAQLAIRGYNPIPMIRAIEHAHLSPHDIAALAAFIEQIGPEG